MESAHTYHAVIHRPTIDCVNIDEIRKKYDPTHGLIGPHVTLLFPVCDAALPFDALRAHVESVAGRTPAFAATMSELEMSWDQWLFLGPGEGNGREEYEALHKTLYEGPLRPFLRADIPYAPHIGLGHFALESDYSLKDPEAKSLDTEGYAAARREIEALGGLSCTVAVDEIEIISLDDQFGAAEVVGGIPLAGQAVS